jgi:hypothetical protein
MIDGEGATPHGNALSAFHRSHTAMEDIIMPHLFDPKRIDSQITYLAALDELDALMAEEPDASAGHRIDELFALIEDYEFRQAARAA